MAAIIGIVSRHGISIDACCEILSNKTKLALYNPPIHLNSHLKWLYISNKAENFSYKGRCGVCRCCMCIETFKRRADLGNRYTGLVGLLVV